MPTMGYGDPKCEGGSIGANFFTYPWYSYSPVDTDAILRIYEAMGNGQIDENQARAILSLKFGDETARKLMP